MPYVPHPFHDVIHDGLVLLPRRVHVPQDEVLHRRDPVPVEFHARQVLERLVNLFATLPEIPTLMIDNYRTMNIISIIISTHLRSENILGFSSISSTDFMAPAASMGGRDAEKQ